MIVVEFGDIEWVPSTNRLGLLDVQVKGNSKLR